MICEIQVDWSPHRPRVITVKIFTDGAIPQELFPYFAD
jgi:hypothetical protein